MRRRRILFAGFMARLGDTRLPKCIMFGELVGDVCCVGGKEKECTRCLLDDLRAFGIKSKPVDVCSPGRGGMAQDRGTRGRNVSWRNGSLQGKSVLGYGMQCYARTCLEGQRRAEPKSSVLAIVD